MTALTDAYLPAIKSMDDGPPRQLQPLAEFFAAQNGAVAADVSLSELRGYLTGAITGDPLRFVCMAVAGWDATTVSEAWTDNTEEHSAERRGCTYRKLGLDQATSDAMDAAFPQTRDGSVVISEEFQPWYTDERRTAHEFYWRAYRKHLIDTGFDPDAIPKLDTATTRVVERLSGPTRPQAYQSKGLVIGYVQSGKTANFTGVLAKGIDAGYRLVIVLTGTIDLLRKQTQRRLDMELVGVENIYLGIDPDDTELAQGIDYFQDPDRIDGKFLTYGFVRVPAPEQPAPSARPERRSTQQCRVAAHGPAARSVRRPAA